MSQQSQFYTTTASYVGFVKQVGTGENIYDQYQVTLANGVTGFAYAKTGNKLNFDQGHNGKFEVFMDKFNQQRVKLFKENSGKKSFGKGGGYGKSKEEIALNAAVALVSNMTVELMKTGSKVNPSQAAQSVIQVADVFKGWVNAGQEQTSTPAPATPQPAAPQPPANPAPLPPQPPANPQPPQPPANPVPPANPGGAMNPQPPLNDPFS